MGASASGVIGLRWNPPLRRIGFGEGLASGYAREVALRFLASLRLRFTLGFS